MSKTTVAYCQCRLRLGKRTQTTFIPAEHAQVGNTLRLRDRKTGSWEDGWFVETVGDSRPAYQVERGERKFLSTREMSDI